MPTSSAVLEINGTAGFLPKERVTFFTKRTHVIHTLQDTYNSVRGEKLYNVRYHDVTLIAAFSFLRGNKNSIPRKLIFTFQPMFLH